MAGSTPECDWKYMRTIHDELLECLCKRINRQSAAILEQEDCSQHEQYLTLYRHIQDSDQIIADCFNDLKRSNLIIKLAALLQQGILTPEHLGMLSPETEQKLIALKELQEK